MQEGEEGKEPAAGGGERVPALKGRASPCLEPALCTAGPRVYGGWVVEGVKPLRALELQVKSRNVALP